MSERRSGLDRRLGPGDLFGTEFSKMRDRIGRNVEFVRRLPGDQSDLAFSELQKIMDFLGRPGRELNTGHQDLIKASRNALLNSSAAKQRSAKGFPLQSAAERIRLSLSPVGGLSAGRRASDMAKSMTKADSFSTQKRKLVKELLERSGRKFFGALAIPLAAIEFGLDATPASDESEQLREAELRGQSMFQEALKRRLQDAQGQEMILP